MNWERIMTAARETPPMELAPRPHEASTSARTHEAATMVLTLAAFVLNVVLSTPASVEVPEVVQPVPSAFQDCRLQNFGKPRLLAQCEDLKVAQ